MKLVYAGNFVAILVFLLFVVIFVSADASNEPRRHQKRFIVKIPPPVNFDQPEHERFWRFQKFLFPQLEVPENQPELIPNFCGLFIVALEKDGGLRINYEKIGSLSDPQPLTARLREIFEEREKNGVFEENSRRVIKAVMLKAPRSAKYGEITTIVDALKTSGADPIVLQIDCLPE